MSQKWDNFFIFLDITGMNRKKIPTENQNRSVLKARHFAVDLFLVFKYFYKLFPNITFSVSTSEM